MKSFSGKTAAITGAASGIGRALSLELAQAGCHLALSDVQAAALKETAQLVARPGLRVTVHPVDVSRREQVEAWARDAALTHGAIHLIFNNAGVAQSGTVEGTSYEEYEWLLGINLWGVIHGTKAFLPYLKASGDGHVVNISSVFGLAAQPGVSAYNTSKFAVRGFTESLRQELDLLDCGVSATCVHPGGIRTAINRSARMSDSVRQLFGTGASETQAQFEHFLRTSPGDAARSILAGVRQDARRVLIGADAWALDQVQRTWPSGYQALFSAFLRRARKLRTPAPAPT